MPRNLGLDVGDRKIGVAISDPLQILATPLKTIIREADGPAINEILELVQKNDIRKIIIGLPYSLDGSIGRQAEKVLDFKAKLATRTGVEIIMQDERLSSVSANRRLREAGRKASKIKKEIDAEAATIILQSYLDTIVSSGGD